jgi:hypothetical protein
MFCFNFQTNTWSPVWDVDGVVITTSAVRGTQVSLTEPQELLIGPKFGSGGYIWKLNENVNTNDAIVFNAVLRFNSVMIAPPGQTTVLEAVITEASVQPTVTALMQEISGTALGTAEVQNEPPGLDATTTLSSKRHYLSPLPVPTVCRHFQIELAWDAVDDAAELYAIGFTHNPSRIQQ